MIKNLRELYISMKEINFREKFKEKEFILKSNFVNKELITKNTIHT